MISVSATALAGVRLAGFQITALPNARAGAILPKQGDKPPWDTGSNNYLYDLFYSKFKGMTLDSLEITVADKFKKDS